MQRCRNRLYCASIHSHPSTEATGASISVFGFTNNTFWQPFNLLVDIKSLFVFVKIDDCFFCVWLHTDCEWMKCQRRRKNMNHKTYKYNLLISTLRWCELKQLFGKHRKLYNANYNSSVRSVVPDVCDLVWPQDRIYFCYFLFSNESMALFATISYIEVYLYNLKIIFGNKVQLALANSDMCPRWRKLSEVFLFFA